MTVDEDDHSLMTRDKALESVHVAIDKLMANGYDSEMFIELKKYSNYARSDLDVKDHLMRWVKEDATNDPDFGFILKYSSRLSADDINFIIDKISNNDSLSKYERGFDLLTLAQSICKNYPEYVEVIDFNKLYSTELMSNFNGNFLIVMDWMKINAIYARKIIELFTTHNLLSSYVDSLYHNIHTLGSDYEYFCTLFNLQKGSRITCESFINYYNLPQESVIGINI